MNLKLSFFLILFILKVVYTSTDEYFKKSIFRALKNRNGQFFAKIDQVEPILSGENFTILEYFNFETGHGKIYKHLMTREKKVRLPTKTIYMTKTKEFYRIFLHIKNRCYSDFIDRLTIKSELLKWSPADVYNKNFGYTNLGPSVLLEVLLEQLEQNRNNAVECVNKDSKRKRCTIKFSKKIKIKYYLEENDTYTMIPALIDVLQKNPKNQKWNHLDRFVYQTFKIAFNEKPIINESLDIGYGCGRLNSKNYPQIQTPIYKDKVKLDFQVTFNYIEVKHDSRLVYVEDKFNFRNITTRTYLNSIYIDKKKSINIIDTINEQTNSPTTILVNLNKLSVLYNFDVNSGKCLAYDLPKYRLINWYYLQEQIIFNPQLFIAYNNYYSYIGEFLVDNVSSLVFEKKFVIDHSRKPSDEKTYPKNSTLINKNRVYPDNVLATHYYAKDRNYWPNNKENFSVPFKIEFHLYSNAIPWLEIANLTIHIKSFDTDPKSEPKFDVTKCEKFGSSGNSDQKTTSSPPNRSSNETLRTIGPSTTFSTTSTTSTQSPDCTKLNDEDKKSNSSIVITD